MLQHGSLHAATELNGLESMSADKQPTSTVVQLANGQFAKGNPGRQPGTKNKISRETLHSIQNLRGEALDQLRSLIAQGDFRAITYILDRILPRERTLELDDASPATITEMLASGEIAPDEARNIATTLAKLSEIGDLVELKNRLAELEAVVATRR